MIFIPQKALRYIKVFTMEKGTELRPAVDEEWTILGGRVSHIRATATHLTLRDMQNRVRARFINMPATISISDISLSLNPIDTPTNVDKEQTTNTRNIPFQSNMKLQYAAGTGSTADLIIEVVKIHPETGERLA